MAEKHDALAQQQQQNLAPAPSYIPKGRRGFEDTVQTDISIPRLALAQALSPQVTDGDPSRIPDLKPGDLFNSVTGHIYGRSVQIQVLRKMPLRAVEFNPIESGGGIKDPNVPLGDPRLRWGNSGDKKADRPQATLFRDFIARVMTTGEMIALSFKSSGINAAKTLWGLATMNNRDCFAGLFEISTGVKLTPKPHQIYKVAQVGWVSESDFKLGEELYESVQTIKAEQVHVDASEVDPEDFDPSEIARSGSDM